MHRPEGSALNSTAPRHGVGFVTVTGDPESTTQIYTLLADKIADDEIRAARRRRDTRR